MKSLCQCQEGPRSPWQNRSGAMKANGSAKGFHGSAKGFHGRTHGAEVAPQQSHGSVMTAVPMTVPKHGNDSLIRDVFLALP